VDRVEQAHFRESTKSKEDRFRAYLARLRSSAKTSEALGFHVKSSVFSKVGVEGKSVVDMQTFHQGKAGTVGKTEVVICEGLKETPGFFDGFRCDIFDADKLTLPKSSSKLDGYLMTSSEADDGIAFIKHIVTGDQCLACFKARVFKINGLRMIDIATILKGKKSRGIHKYHLEDRP